MHENQPNEDVWFWLWELTESSKRKTTKQDEPEPARESLISIK